MSQKKVNKKSKIILSILFFGPLLFYLSLLTGTHSYTKLPVLTENINSLKQFEDAEDHSFVGHVTVLAFLGEDVLNYKTNALNLNEKIYKNFYGYPDFQILVLMPVGTEEKVAQLRKELGATSDIEKWYFVFKEKKEIKEIFQSLHTPYLMNEVNYSPYAFIIDKNGNLRGRNDDEDEVNGLLYGYNAETVALIHQKMVDDMKVLMAEYRLALKSNKREI
ncbi:hypothetical protein [Namhaeicola litoreus]|uniref:Uncharacterized protein n=1 Tax=Namhaeicola litoreus TaxID=1052145 RepID=A0ABW3XXH2_9FLAO